MPSTEWLLFRFGDIQIIEGNLLDPNVNLNPLSRRLGAAWLKIPSHISKEQPNIENCSGLGVMGGKHESIKVTQFPTKDDPNSRLFVEIDSRERRGKYTWYNHAFKRNEQLCAYTETDSMKLLPIK